MPEKILTVYCAPRCRDCIRSKTLLDALGVPYTEINIEQDDAARRRVLELTQGYQSVPTIVFFDGSVLKEPTDQQLREHLAELGYIEEVD